jgi:hypothetical protein
MAFRPEGFVKTKLVIRIRKKSMGMAFKFLYIFKIAPLEAELHLPNFI